jgi:hypothetical protein
LNISIIARARVLGAAAVVAGVLGLAGATGAYAAEPGFGQLFLNDHVVGTVVPPAHVDPGSGLDPFFKVTNGAAGQLGIAGIGPGEPGFHGGDWQVFTVTFNSGVQPYLLESGAEVAAAAQRGDVTVTRQPAQDFRCPITAA